MALSATIYKAELTIADMDRHYYQNHELTLAQHPSETELRMMIRLAAFILNADEQLSFTKGLSTDDEPDLWNKSLSDEIELWIDLGQPEEKRIRKACGRAKQVIIYTYNKRSATIWWKQQSSNLARFKNLKIIHLDAERIENLVQRTMQLQCSIQDAELYISDNKNNIMLSQTHWE